MTADVEAYLAARVDRCVAELRDLCAIPGISTQPAHKADVERAARFAARAAGRVEKPARGAEPDRRSHQRIERTQPGDFKGLALHELEYWRGDWAPGGFACEAGALGTARASAWAPKIGPSIQICPNVPVYRILTFVA
jgi:hypothetical protein